MIIDAIFQLLQISQEVLIEFLRCPNDILSWARLLFNVVWARFWRAQNAQTQKCQIEWTPDFRLSIEQFQTLLMTSHISKKKGITPGHSSI